MMQKKVKKKTIVTNHGKRRMNERITGSLTQGKNNKSKLCSMCIKNGITFGKYKNKDSNSPFYHYLKSKLKSGYIMYLYQKNLFIFSESKILITFYPIPNKYLKHYDKFIREKNNTSHLVYLVDRNTKKLKPFLHFRTKKEARKCVYNLLGKPYQNKLKYQKTEEGMLEFLAEKKLFKIVESKISERILKRDKKIYQKIFEKLY